ncbi:MAG TPA: 50S ribosomal protein L10 [Bacillota bacterium]|nr:50S ribosomal protein L10 [Bacillota bacterium]HOL08952.1 50S ribosomal protein L10 [Bacillota bacterium]HPO96494.1 50S ribosomal protein L10 [Bacillota bacterium]
MARPEKEALVKEIQEKFEKSKSVILVDYRGLNVAEVTELRKKMREAGTEYKVLKNTMTSRAAKAANIEGLDDLLVGPIALAFSYDDHTSAAKVLSAFAKDNKKMQLIGGVLDGKIIDAAGVKALSELPSREVLLGKIAGMLQAPMRGMATVLSGPLRNFVYAIEAVRKQQAVE